MFFYYANNLRSMKIMIPTVNARLAFCASVAVLLAACAQTPPAGEIPQYPQETPASGRALTADEAYNIAAQEAGAHDIDLHNYAMPVVSHNDGAWSFRFDAKEAVCNICHFEVDVDKNGGTSFHSNGH